MCSSIKKRRDVPSIRPVHVQAVMVSTYSSQQVNTMKLSREYRLLTHIVPPSYI